MSATGRVKQAMPRAILSSTSVFTKASFTAGQAGRESRINITRLYRVIIGFWIGSSRLSSTILKRIHLMATEGSLI
jgi:hypothetical protein